MRLVGGGKGNNKLLVKEGEVLTRIFDTLPGERVFLRCQTVWRREVPTKAVARVSPREGVEEEVENLLMICQRVLRFDDQGNSLFYHRAIKQLEEWVVPEGD